MKIAFTGWVHFWLETRPTKTNPDINFFKTSNEVSSLLILWLNIHALFSALQFASFSWKKLKIARFIFLGKTQLSFYRLSLPPVFFWWGLGSVSLLLLSLLNFSFFYSSKYMRFANWHILFFFMRKESTFISTY